MRLAPALVATALALGAPSPVAAQGASGAGDFRVGDQILLQVLGDSVLSDTFTVAPGIVIGLPNIGDIPLGGVRRSELQAYLTQQLARYLKQPVVHAYTLVSIAISGEVAQPGFYPLPGHVVISAAIMRAGGPTRDADVGKVRIEREGKRIWEGESLQQAIADARTLDQMELRPGDRVVFPRTAPRDPWWRIVAIVVPLAGTVIAISR